MVLKYAMRPGQISSQPLLATYQLILTKGVSNLWQRFLYLARDHIIHIDQQFDRMFTERCS